MTHALHRSAMVKTDCLVSMCLSFFFFQAEDGIRDSSVTGVQTCALPISYTDAQLSAFRSADAHHAVYDRMGAYLRLMSVLRASGTGHLSTREVIMPPIKEIGRASCRERV